jgi:membrane peptidoglycan carboxypeptidase
MSVRQLLPLKIGFLQALWFFIRGMIRAIYKIVFNKSFREAQPNPTTGTNCSSDSERTVRRKIREFVLSTSVEAIYSKDQILEMYLNQIPYGSTAYGIEAASELYFGKEAKDLSLAEAALLAGLLRHQLLIHHLCTSRESQGKTRNGLKKNGQDGYISKKKQKSKRRRACLLPGENSKATHFALWVKELLAEKYGMPWLNKGG